MMSPASQNAASDSFNEIALFASSCGTPIP
jgi:hypothetical protein